MRARGWKVGILAEFCPDQQNLLGVKDRVNMYESEAN